MNTILSLFSCFLLRCHFARLIFYPSLTLRLLSLSTTVLRVSCRQTPSTIDLHFSFLFLPYKNISPRRQKVPLALYELSATVDHPRFMRSLFYDLAFVATLRLPPIEFIQTIFGQDGPSWDLQALPVDQVAEEEKLLGGVQRRQYVARTWRQPSENTDSIGLFQRNSLMRIRG